jgi:hypothetical protein
MRTMRNRNIMPATECLARKAKIVCLEADYEQTRWNAVLTSECGFFSAASLQRLFLSNSFDAASKTEDQLGGRRTTALESWRRLCNWQWFANAWRWAAT